MAVDIKKMINLRLKINQLENEKKERKDDIELVELLDKLIKKYEEEVAPIKKQYDEILNFWQTNLYKYFKLTFKNCASYDTIYMETYKLITANRRLFGVYDFNSDYDKGLRDTSIDLKLFFDYDYDLVEITKEEFLQKAIENFDRPLNSRLDKLAFMKESSMTLELC